MAQRIAVVTDVLSDQHFFPLWRRYYGGLFGDTNLFVVTYAGAAAFPDAGLGGVLRLPVGYDDRTRASAITDLVALLDGLGGPLTPWFSPTLVFTLVLLLLTIVNRARRALAESPLHR